MTTKTEDAILVDLARPPAPFRAYSLTPRMRRELAAGRTVTVAIRGRVRSRAPRRRRAAASRTSSRSGDSGDSGPGRPGPRGAAATVAS
jgi:hypothetical protein